jgi:Cu/Ag efflux protein CusF
MIRSIFALAALALGLSAASADELKGTIKKVNKDANKLTLTIDGKDRTLPVSKDASFVTVTSQKSKKGKPKETVTPIDGGLGALKEGSAVTVLTEKAGEKDEITSVKVGTGTTTKKKAKKPKKPTALLQTISTNSAAGEELMAGKQAAKKADKAKGKKGKKAAKKKGNKANMKKGKKGKKSD